MPKKRTDKTMLADKIVYLVRVGTREVDVDAASAEELAIKLAPLLPLGPVELHAITHTVYTYGTRIESGNWRIRRVGTRPFMADAGTRLPGQTHARKGRKPTTPVEEWGAVELPADDLITGLPTQVPQTLEPASVFLLTGSKGAEIGSLPQEVQSD